MQYKQGQDPYLLHTGTYSSQAGPQQRALIALAPDARTVAIAAGTSLSLYDTITGQHTEDIHDVHNGAYFMPLEIVNLKKLRDIFFMRALGTRLANVTDKALVHGYTAMCRGESNSVRDDFISTKR